MRASTRSVIRSTLRSVGYDIASADAWRDVDIDVRRVVKSPHPVIFDVGANVGDTVKQLRGLFPGSTVHAFEPGSQALAALRRNLGNDRNVVINNIALGDEAGDRVFIENKSTVMSSFLENGPDSFGEIDQTRTVNVGTIDSYCADAGIPFIDLMKIDVQGYDLNVLNGASRMMTNGNIGAVLLEIMFIELYKGAAPAHELLRKMSDSGFEIAGLYHFSYRRNRLGWMDALFVNPKIA
jgi:FkbM family methyltransferase